MVLGDSLTALLEWFQLDLNPLWPTLGIAFFCPGFFSGRLHSSPVGVLWVYSGWGGAL